MVFEEDCNGQVFGFELAQVGKHGSCLNGSQLVLVSQQDYPCVFWEGVKQLREEFQGNH